MVQAAVSHSQKIRERLDHPVIDGDGHLIELTPVMMDYLARVGGRDLADRYERDQLVLRTTLAERRDRWQTQTAWWGQPMGNTLDRATVMLPRLLHRRLAEMGLDFAILYPTEGSFFLRLGDTELRR